jgi:hypothetical protein
MKEPLDPSGSRGDWRIRENPVGFEGHHCSGFSFDVEGIAPFLRRPVRVVS